MSVPAYPAYQDSGVEWIGPIPKGWEIKRFRFVFSECGDKIDGEVFGEMLSVSGYRGVEIKAYDDDNRRRLEDELQGYRIVRRGQLVINTMWMNYAGLGVSEFDGHVSPAYRAFDISGHINARYAHHLLRSEQYVKGYTSYLTGIRPNSLQMSRDDLLNLPVLLPPSAEQSAIAAFLDRETGKIDALVAEQERLIALLKEKRQAVISQAVTKGLDPNAPMKDSGVEWLGQVPAHWDVKALASLARNGTSITYGIVQAGPDIPDGVPYIRTSEMSGSELPETGYLRTSPEIAASYVRSRVETGDIVIAIRATVGKALRVPPWLNGANLTQGTARIAPGPLVDPAYLLFMLNSSGAMQGFEAVSKGATFREITLEMLRKFRVPLPPRDEQEAIVHFLKGDAGRLENLSADAERAIALLKERRAALISAAVTGKIDVRSLVPAAQEAA